MQRTAVDVPYCVAHPGGYLRCDRRRLFPVCGTAIVIDARGEDEQGGRGEYGAQEPATRITIQEATQWTPGYRTVPPLLVNRKTRSSAVNPAVQEPQSTDKGGANATERPARSLGQQRTTRGGSSRCSCGPL